MPDDDLEEYLAMVREQPPLDPGAERELVLRARTGDEAALTRLVGANLHRVLPISEALRDERISRSALIDEGNLGLLRAAFRYDEHAGQTFGEFAERWIRAAMRHAVAQVAGDGRSSSPVPAEHRDGDGASATGRRR